MAACGQMDIDKRIAAEAERDRLAARVAELEAMLNEPPILSKYHGMRGFEEDRFIDDYGEWRRRVRALLEPTP